MKSFTTKLDEVEELANREPVVIERPRTRPRTAKDGTVEMVPIDTGIDPEEIAHLVST